MINVEKYVNKFDTLNLSFYFTNSNQIELYNALFYHRKEKKEGATDRQRERRRERENDIERHRQREIEMERERVRDN